MEEEVKPYSGFLEFTEYLGKLYSVWKCPGYWDNGRWRHLHAPDCLSSLAHSICSTEGNRIDLGTYQSAEKYDESFPSIPSSEL